MSYTFVWPFSKENAPSEVFIAGSFNNWKCQKLQRKADSFELTLHISSTPAQFKFVVDGVWVTSPHIPTTRDNNNIVNNVIYESNLTKNKSNSPVSGSPEFDLQDYVFIDTDTCHIPQLANWDGSTRRSPGKIAQIGSLIVGSLDGTSGTLTRGFQGLFEV